MPIDREQAMKATLQEAQASYVKDQVILYHLGIGAGVPPTDPRELEYTFEKNLKVLPSFAVVVDFKPQMNLLKIPGMTFDPYLLLHGEQDVEIHKPLPPEATGITARMRIADIYDKGKAAVAIVEIRAEVHGGSS